ncbi:MAG: xanthine dehydrogenase family protein molybdopterin-binding subunit [Dehalococcoidia bacterium]
MALQTKSPKIIGASIQRVEDARLTTGRGQFIDDIALPHMLEAAILRSRVAHAKILRIDASRALALPGVYTVLTGRELAEITHPQPIMWRVLPEQRETNTHAMAVDRVRWVGQAVAAVVARDRYVAEDALALIEVEYEPLPVVHDLESALAEGAPKLYDDWPDNLLGAKMTFASGDVETAFAKADVVVRERFKVGRHFSCPLETRGCIATWDPHTDAIDLWLCGQAPNTARDFLGETLGIPIHKIRVRTPHIGGGFGCKFDFYGEEVIACVLSRRVGRPVKWIEDRVESFVATSHAREEMIEAEMAATKDGMITGIRGTFYGVLGGATGMVASGPPWLAMSLLTGPYKIPNASTAVVGVLTNRAPLGSYRGWGQPEANFVHDRLVELVARKLGIDRNEMRRKNFPKPEEFPFNTGVVWTYDSGRYSDCLDLCLEGLKTHGWSKRQTEARAAGRSVGIGFSFHIEVTAFGPTRFQNDVGLEHSGFDEEVVRIDSSGRVTVLTGQVSIGQGMETTLAQLAAETLGVRLEDVTVFAGDTASCPYTGYGTAASRGAPLAGGAVIGASKKLREQVLRIAGQILEVAPEDLTIEDSRIGVVGVPDRYVTMADIGDAAYRRLSGKLPTDMSPTLEERCVFDTDAFAMTYGCTAVMAEVDRETGVVTLLDYLTAHDCGTVINPTIVDGQLHGGAAQAIAGALYEDLVYDDAGQPLATTFMDYLMPTASEIPRFTHLHMETPSPHIPGGIKGMGESGTIPGFAAIANAIDDALSDLGVTVTTLPVTPPRLLELIRTAKTRA